ncbi:MAG: hypothetical protein ACSHXY_10765 [Alphaproteobacteria bacterium]
MTTNTFIDASHGTLVQHIESGNVWLTEFEQGIVSDWEPEHWGADGFTNIRDALKFIEDSENGVLMLAYSNQGDKPHLVGIYQLDTSETVHLHDYISLDSLENLTVEEAKYWVHAFKAVRGWKYVGDPVNPEVLFPETFSSLESSDAEATKISDGNVDRLLEFDWEEHGVYSNDPFEGKPSVYIKGAYGFDPPSWGCVGWKTPGRAQTLIKKTTNPFLMAIWVTVGADSPAAGKVAGFFELTHETGARAKFISPEQDANHEQGAWEHSLRASRAWEILPEYQPKIREFFPAIHENNRALTTATSGGIIPPMYVEALRKLPRREIEVYGVNRSIDGSISVPSTSGLVRGGNGRKGGYTVGEPRQTQKELYILELKSEQDAHVEKYMGHKVGRERIFKVGLSMSPQSRCDTLNNALPNGAYYWEVIRTTLLDNHERYSNFDVAKAGEDAMKSHLAQKHRDNTDSTKHLGGEFYLVETASIEEAWNIGRETALKAERENNG